ncbi:MAG: LuxR C-terminal-related transcriptional regulator [Hyphomonas sp.]
MDFKSILPSHVRPPKRRGSFLPRTVLADRVFKATCEAQLVLVVAPSGYGKTTLLTEVFNTLEHTNTQAIWINVSDAGHDEAWLSLALTQQISSMCDVPLGNIDTFTSLVFDHFTEEQPLHVFIDNWNFLDESKSASLFERILQETAGLVRFIVSSRSNPSFNYEPLRLDGDFVVFTSSDLSFSTIECAQVLFDANSVPKPLLPLVEKTEGWPAAVQMLRLALKEAGHGFAERMDFKGSRADMTRYLSSSFFDHLPKKRQSFLLDLALFPEFNLALIDDVLGQNAAEQVKDLVHNGVFISEVARESGSYRLHPLLRDYLLERRKSGAQVGTSDDILKRAALFERQQGSYENAITFSINAKAHDIALDLISEEGPRLNSAGKVRKFSEWAHQLSTQNVDLPADVTRWHIWSLVFSGRWQEAAILAEDRPEAVDAEIQTVIATFSDNLELMQDGLANWRRERRTEDPPFQTAVMYCAEAIAFLATGQNSDAETSLHKAGFAIEQTESMFGRIWVKALTAMSYLLHGRVDIGERVIREAIKLAERYFGPKAHICSICREVAAIIAAERCADEQARRDLEQADEAEKIAHIPFIMLYTEHYSKILKTPWHSPAETTAMANPQLGLLQRALVLRDELRAYPDEATADNLWNVYKTVSGSELVDDMTSTWSLGHMQVSNSARLHLIKNEPREALAILTPLLRRIGRGEEGISSWTLDVLKAAALDRNGDRRAAVRLLIATTEKIVSGGALKTLVAERAFLEPLLPALAEAGLRAPLGDPEGWRRLRDLLQLKAFENETKAKPDPSEILEEPTDRERELLEFIHYGLSNQEIADRLGITVPTVKWHLHNLFGKLGVRNRSSAVRVGRETGFIQ